MVRDSSLHYFYAVAQAGSVRGAADRLNISSSAISRMVAKAEDEFRAPLFERHSNGMRLTAAGELLFKQLGTIFAQLESVKAQIEDLQASRHGHVALACIEGVLHELAPGFLTEFHRRHPGVTFAVESAAPDQIIAAIQSDTADIGILFGALHQTSIEVLLEYESPLHVLVVPSHPLASFGEISLREVARHPIAMPNMCFGARRVLDAALKSSDIEIPMVLTTNSIDLTLRMVRSGEAATMLGRFVAQNELQSGKLVAVPIVERQLVTGSLVVCKRPDRRLSPPAQQLLGYIERSFSASRQSYGGTL